MYPKDTVNSMKKRLLALGLCVVMAFSATACGKDSKKDNTASSGNVSKVANTKADMKGTEYKTAVKLPDYKSLTVAESVAAVSDASVAKVDCLLLSSGYFDINMDNITKKEGTVSNYDLVNIDYVGTKDGVEFDGGSAEGYILGIGTGTFIDGFEEGLIGVQTGQTVELSLTFPDTYSNTDLAGQDVIFTVTVNYIAEMNDTFVQDNADEIYYFMYQYFATPDRVETVEEYYETIKKNMKVVNIVSDKFQTIRDSAEITDDADELAAFLEEQKAPYIEMAEAYEMEFLDVVYYYTQTSFSTEEEFDEYLTDIFHNYVVMIALAREEGLEVTEDEYTTLVQSFIDHSSGQYADIAAFQEDYPKQDSVDDILCGKVYHKIAEYIEVVPDAEAEQDTTTSEAAE